MVARLGGDEFVIVLPGVGELAEARRIANLVTAAVERPLAYAGGELRIGVSFGISVFPADANNTDALLKLADEDMYRAKLKRKPAAADQSKSGPLAA
jgi:diguanylate cyclase (GGDEF)-like protein